MTDGTPNYATLKARHVAMQCLRAHPLPDTRRNALFGALIEHMDTNRICFPGTRRLATLTRISRPHVLKLLNEFERLGLIDFIDPPQKGRRIRRVRLNYERVVGYVVVNHALPLEEDELVNPALTTQESRVVKEPQPFKQDRVVNFEAVNGQPYVDPNRKQEEVLVPKASAPDSNAFGSLASEKGDVRGKADAPSNDAVKKSGCGPRAPEPHQIRARGL